MESDPPGIRIDILRPDLRSSSVRTEPDRYASWWPFGEKATAPELYELRLAFHRQTSEFVASKVTPVDDEHASSSPFGEKAIELSPKQCFLILIRERPELESHSLTVPSEDADANCSPFCEKITL